MSTDRAWWRPDPCMELPLPPTSQSPTGKGMAGETVRVEDAIAEEIQWIEFVRDERSEAAHRLTVDHRPLIDPTRRPFNPQRHRLLLPFVHETTACLTLSSNVR